MNSVGMGWFIMSKNIAEKWHGTVLLVVELDVMENFCWAEVISAATFGRKINLALLQSPSPCSSDTIPTKNGRELMEKWVSELMTNL